MAPPDDSTLLARLDERTKGIAEDIAEMRKASENYVTKASSARSIPRVWRRGADPCRVHGRASLPHRTETLRSYHAQAVP